MLTELPSFRPGNVLATRFTGTLTERHGDSVERIPTPERLQDWLATNGLTVQSCTPEDLAHARELRESIHAAATAAAAQAAAIPESALSIINSFSSQGSPAAILTADGKRSWRLNATSGVEDALSVIAADAISIIAAERDGKLAICGSAACRAVFLDTSQSRTRKWCDMNTCGNRQKKARLKTKQAGRAQRRQAL